MRIYVGKMRHVRDMTGYEFPVNARIDDYVTLTRDHLTASVHKTKKAALRHARSWLRHRPLATIEFVGE